ncbi:MAG: hybrid sensor histidine kinase/response regulator, partial [Bacteroidia bacterium]
MSKIDDNLTEKAILRLKAEEKLKEEQINMGNPLPESDTKKLLHELQVHQIELEMQNEELKEAYDTMEKALRKYTMLYDFAPMAYITLNYEALIRDLNFTSAELLAEKRFA